MTNPNPLSTVMILRLKQLGVENPIIHFKEPYLGLSGRTEYIQVQNGSKKGDYMLYLPHIGEYQIVLNFHSLCWQILNDMTN